MALETLMGVKKIDSFNVMVMDDLRKDRPELFNESGSMDYKKFEEEIRPNYPIQIRHDKNSISFTIQQGPIKEFGVNGCQVDTIIKAAQTIIMGLDKKLPCKENQIAIDGLQIALAALDMRRIKREARGVEGTRHA